MYRRKTKIYVTEIKKTSFWIRFRICVVRFWIFSWYSINVEELFDFSTRVGTVNDVCSTTDVLLNSLEFLTLEVVSDSPAKNGIGGGLDPSSNAEIVEFILACLDLPNNDAAKEEQKKIRVRL